MTRSKLPRSELLKRGPFTNATFLESSELFSSGEQGTTYMNWDLQANVSLRKSPQEQFKKLVRNGGRKLWDRSTTGF